MINFRSNYLFLIVLISSFLIVGLYVGFKYKILQENIASIELIYGNKVGEKEVPLIYISKDEESDINFETVYKFRGIDTRDNLAYSCEFSGEKKIRKLRLYFPYPEREVLISSICLKTSHGTISMPLNKINDYDGIICEQKSNGIRLEIIKKNGYVELPVSYIYISDFYGLYKLLVPFLIAVIFGFLVVKSLRKINIDLDFKKNIILFIFISCIFLPAPIYNVALILLATLYLKKTSWNAIKSEKINIIFIGLFLVYLINNLLVSEGSFRQMSTIERFLPLLVLGGVIPSIADRKSLYLFPISAFLIGYVFLLTSIFDAYIHKNLVFLSFDLFSKYLHPVYFSYLLFFSICYIDLNFRDKKKYILEFFLFLFLLLCGSKMVLVFSMVVVFFNFFKKKKKIFFFIPLVGMAVLFAPLKERFLEILNIKDFSVLKEKRIEDPFDKRVNGLTFRLILWREALKTMDGLSYLVGKGVTKETNKLLETRLTNVGLLNHKKYNPHNQYVDTFWRTGIVGLFLLILIPLYSLRKGIMRKDRLTIIFSLFMMAVMCSESIFGRVNGIYFFSTVLLILMNSNTVNENSDIRN